MKINIAFIFVLGLFTALNAQNKKDNNSTYKISPTSITIARDNWGVAHIFGKNDADVAYGLAWANAEDAFHLLQEMVAIGKGKMGVLKGKEGAKTDFFVQAIGARNAVDSLYNTLEPKYLEYLNGYCQGLNAYAAQYPEKLLIKNLFPVTDKDMLTTYVACFSFLSGAPFEMQKILSGKLDSINVEFNTVGSNAYAFNASKTTDRKTYLCINPHFFVDGPLSFYEAHLNSEEGLNITGALFHGGGSIFLGNNNDLGWAHTYNYIDQIDVFALRMKDKNHYYLDSQVHKLESVKIKLKVKVKGITIPVKKKVYRSKHGLVLQSENNKFYALRSPAFDNIKMGQEYYKMNKAKDLDEFKEALSMNALNMFNIVYADKKDNILYICNGRSPKRNENFDFYGIVRGDTSAAIWTEYHKLNAMPQVKNPYSGYVFNTNNTPANATGEKDNYPKEKISKYMDLRPGNNNRAHRFMEQIEGLGRVNFEEFKDLKFDLKHSKNTPFFKSLDNLFALDPNDYPHLTEVLEIIQSWDGNCDSESIPASLFFVALEKAFEKLNYNESVFISGVQISDEILIESIQEAAAFLLKHYNTFKVPFGELIRHERNGKLHPVTGFPDALVPAYAKYYKDGKYKVQVADTYIHFVRFNEQGADKIETLLPFDKNPTAEEYEDELKMFNQKKLKTMSLDKEKIFSTAKQIYSPIRVDKN